MKPLAGCLLRFVTIIAVVGALSTSVALIEHGDRPGPIFTLPQRAR